MVLEGAVVLRSQDTWIEVETAVKVQLVRAKILLNLELRPEKVLTWGSPPP